MNPTGWFCIFLIPMFLSGYFVGRFFLPSELHFPYPVATVGKIAYAMLTLFLVLRTILSAVVHEHVNLFSAVSAYADITVLVGGVMLGYARASQRALNLAVGEDVVLRLVEPFDDPANTENRT
jgi:hypothetical protein